MSNINNTIEEENNILNIEQFIQFIRRRKKTFLLTSSLIFSILLINTVKKYLDKKISENIKFISISKGPNRNQKYDVLHDGKNSHELNNSAKILKILREYNVMKLIIKNLGL